MSRKISDVILDLENKINKITQLLENCAFTNNLILNKLNQLDQLDKLKLNKSAKPFSVFAEPADVKTTIKTETSTPKTISVSNESKQIDENPIGHRRTARHENYSGSKPLTTQDGFSTQVQVPQGKGTQIINKAVQIEMPTELHVDAPTDISIPVVQRIVDGNNKSVFMAEVNILAIPGLESKAKIRTGGTGKWSSVLPLGNYRAIIKKRDKQTKNEIQTTFDFSVSEKNNPLELETLIFNNK